VYLRPYTTDDKAACLALIDDNTPDFFAPHENTEFDTFLDNPGDAYWVAEDDAGTVVGCTGYWVIAETPTAIITWTMVERSLQGRGIGRLLLLTCLRHLCRVPDVQTVTLETSQHIVGFYEHIAGFEVQEVVKDGYASGLHKVKMRREMRKDGCEAIAQQIVERGLGN